MQISVDELRVVAKKAILHYGYDEAEALAILEVLLYAQLRGNNQGVVKLVGAGIPKSPDALPPSCEKETNVSALLNAHGTHAMIAVNAAVDVLLAKAKEHGLAVVGVNHVATSSGALGYYAKRIADAGFVGFVFAGSMETVAAHGSFEAMFGTNPLAMGVPSQGESLVLDMATSAMAYYGVVEANIAGRALPEHIAFDKTGNPTTLPKDVLDGGALRTFDQGAKGSGLSMMVQALTGPLTRSYFTGVGDVKENWGGHLLIALDPEILGGLEAMREGVSQMIAKVKASKKLDGVQEIFVPSERGNRMSSEALASNTVTIEDNLYAALKALA